MSRLATVAAVLMLGLVAPACDRRIDVDFSYAFEREDWPLAEKLLADGADIDAQFIRADGFTTLMMAARTKWNPEGLEWLLDHGADPDAQSFRGHTALHVAAARGRTKHVQILLAAGADVNPRNDRGDTPLKLAHDYGHRIIERLIREAGGGY